MKDISDGDQPGSRTGVYVKGVLPAVDDGSVIFNINCDQRQSDYRTFMVNTAGNLESWISNKISANSTMTASYSYIVPKKK